LPRQNPSLENYNIINSLGFFTRARAYLLQDLKKESDYWKNDGDFVDSRNEFAKFEFEISLLTRRIERYELALSLSLSQRTPILFPCTQSENTNIPQLSPPIPIAEANVKPPDKATTKLD